MPDRTQLRAAFLNGTAWENWSVEPLPADASARSYLRLRNHDQSVIIMDAPPQTGEDLRPFIQISNWLNEVQVAAPAILKTDLVNGFLALQDLGVTDFALQLSTRPSDDLTLYTAATDVLIHLQLQDAPDLHRMTPNIGGDMVRIAAEFYTNSATLADDLAAEVSDALATNCGAPDVLALRDFHAENLIWRPEKSKLHRVGVLDFQDAFLAPDGYDLASLLRDARRDVQAACAEHVLTHYAKKTGQTRTELDAAIACLSVQRNLRILGVFGRLIKTQSKRRYIAMLPRVWAHVMKDAQHPALTRLQGVVSKGIPDPKHPSITAWTA